MNSIWQFGCAGMLRFGRGSIESLPKELVRLSMRRPIIVSDPVVLSLSSVQQTLHSIKAIGIDAVVFDGCEAEPSIDIAVRSAAKATESLADSVIGIGGGSNMDVAKITATLLQHRGAPSDYFGFDAIPGPIKPLVAVPTTAGTGSEVSHSAVLTDTAAKTKVSTLSRWLRPSIAIVDPQLTDSCPPRVSAHSGIDALVHAIEAYTNRDFSTMGNVNPQSRAYEGSYVFTRLIAAEAIRLVSKNLVRVFRTPDDKDARDGMAMAAMLAGMAFSNSGVAIVHALEYPVGALTYCSHGEGNGLLLPHVMRFNAPSCIERMSEIATYIHGMSSNSDRELNVEELIKWVVQLQQDVEIRTRLRDLGLEQSQIPFVAEQAFRIKRLMDINPRTPSLRDLELILNEAF